MEDTPNNTYVKYCKFFNQFGFFRWIGNLIRSKQLSLISHYLNKTYNLLPNEVITTSIATFTLIYFPLIIIFLQFDFFLGLIIPLLISYFIAYRIFSYPIVNYHKIQHILLQFSDLAFQDFLLILNTTNSIFDAIEYIIAAEYPILSKSFENMLFQINIHGKSPERVISEFIYELPEGNLKDRLLTLMATKFSPNKVVKQLEFLAGEKKFEYQKVTHQLESKLIIIIGISLFFPIVTAVFISFSGNFAIYLSFVMIPLYIFLSQKLKTQLLNPNFELFGEISLSKQEKHENSHSNLIEFLHFLNYFGNYLKRGTPPEIALLESYQQYDGSLKSIIKNCIIEIFYKNNSFEDGWNKLKTLLKHAQIQFLINLIARMLKKSSVETGNRIISIIQQLKTNQELIQERESILKAQQFKIKFLSFIIAGILGVIAGLTPILLQISKVLTAPTNTIEINFIDAVPLSLSLLIMTVYSAYFLNKLVKVPKPWRFSLWGCITFSSFWYLTGSLI